MNITNGSDITWSTLQQYPKEEYMMIDIRDEVSYNHGYIPGAVNISVEDLNENRKQLPKDKMLVFCCKSGKISKDIAVSFAENGYTAYNLAGGYQEWLLNTFQENRSKEIEKSLQKKFRKSIWCKFTKAINEYELIKEGDKIAICISGGKDSMIMAKLFQELKRHNKFSFEIVFLVMDPGYSEVNRKVIENNAKLLDIPITVFETDIFDAVFDVEKSPCYLCARMRRGHLYKMAKDLGCNKIALGHHYDDVIETILMGMLYGAQVQTMMPKLHSTNFEGMELIRPMYLIREDDIKLWRDYNDLYFIQCACRFTDTCTTCNSGNSEHTGSKRKETKHIIKKLKEMNPNVESNIFKSVENVNLSTIIAYKQDGIEHHFLESYDMK